MKKPKAKPKLPTPVQEEVTHLGVIINILLQVDDEARFRIVNYLLNRFNVKGAR